MTAPSDGRPAAAPAAGAAAWRAIAKHCKNHPNTVRAASLVVFFTVWEFWAKDADPLFIVTPSEIYQAAVWMIEDGTFLLLFSQSMEHFVIGTVLSIVVGTALGVVLALWWQAEYVLDPFINGFYAIPKPALVPLFVFGRRVRRLVVEPAGIEPATS